MDDDLPAAPPAAPAEEVEAVAGPEAGRAAIPEDAGPDDLVVALLRDGPLTVAAIAHRIGAAWPGFLAGRAGLVHPLLLRLVADGRLVPTLVANAWGSRIGYALPSPEGPPAGAAAPPSGAHNTDAAATAALPAGVAQAIAKVAQRAAAGLAHAPPLASRVHRESAEHLSDAVAARLREGAGAKAALRETLKDFGDPWRVRTDLARVAAGRRAYLFPRSFAESLRGSLSHDAWILLVIVAVIVFVRLQVLSAYHIPTRSMEPTLHGDRNDGDRILVNRLSGTPERGEITVFDGWGMERKNYVKRCMGLPNERLRVREGDFYVNDVLLRKRGRLYEDLMFTWWTLNGEWRRARLGNPDDEDAAISDFRDELTDLFSAATGTWLLNTDGSFEGTPPPIGEAVLRLTDPVDDRTYHEDTGEDDGGYPEVPDTRFSVTLQPLDAATRTVLRLTRGSTRVDLAADASDSSLRLVVNEEDVALDDGSPRLPDEVVRVGTDLDVRIALVDRVVRIDVGDLHVEHELPQPEFPRRDAPSGTFEVRVADGPARVRVTRIERDVHYTSDYDDDEWVLGPDEFFMLGDNSSNSEDSRAKGPVHRSRLIGRPILIVWPPRRMRILHAPDEADARDTPK